MPFDYMLTDDYITLHGAYASEDDPPTFTPRGAISVRVASITAYYDHTILVDGHKIRVMETHEDIRKMLVGGDADG